MFTRRRFFQVLAASALAAGVLPAGFPREAMIELPGFEPGDTLWELRYVSLKDGVLGSYTIFRC